MPVTDDLEMRRAIRHDPSIRTTPLPLANAKHGDTGWIADSGEATTDAIITKEEDRRSSPDADTRDEGLRAARS
jgi:hypothetical protein